MERLFRKGRGGLLDVMLYAVPSAIILLVAILAFILIAKPAKLGVTILHLLRVEYIASEQTTASIRANSCSAAQRRRGEPEQRHQPAMTPAQEVSAPSPQPAAPSVASRRTATVRRSDEPERQSPQ